MIHKFHLNGYYIVLDVNSGGVHVVDKLTYRLLDFTADPPEQKCPSAALDALSPEYGRDEILETYEELYTLYQEGILFSSDDYEQFADRWWPPR